MIDAFIRRKVAGVPILMAAACILFAAPRSQGQAGANPAPAGTLAPANQPPLPAFDVASIKPHKDEGMMSRSMMQVTQDGLSVNGVRLDMILRNVFGVSSDRILNQPAWVSSSRFDIEAKVAPEDAPKLKALSQQERWAMLLPVLEDRCGLKFHHETKELQVYALIVAKGGTKLKKAQPADAGAAAPPTKPGAEGAPPAAGRPMLMMRMTAQGMAIESHSSTMASLAQVISLQVSGTVVDKTGLTGKYDYTIKFMPEEGAGPMTMRMPGGGPPPDGAVQAQEPPAPSLFTALEEQLGLKLEAHKEPVDVIEIDHIAQPSPN